MNDTITDSEEAQPRKELVAFPEFVYSEVVETVKTLEDCDNFDVIDFATEDVSSRDAFTDVTLKVAVKVQDSVSLETLENTDQRRVEIGGIGGGQTFAELTVNSRFYHYE